MRIGELSAKSQVSARSIRHYEAAGLITVRRTPNGYRDYDDGALATVIRVQWLISAGLTLRTVSEILPCVVEQEPKKALCERTRSILIREFDRLEHQVERIRKCQQLLERAIGPITDP